MCGLRRAFGLVLLSLMCATAGGAQQNPAPADGTLAVYLDCQNVGCDFDFFRTDITFVNWVRDRQVADVHLLVTGQSTGAGGQEVTVTFIGLRRFVGVTDTLTAIQAPTATEDERRRGLARLFRAGLVRYLARTPAAERLTIAVAQSATPSQQRESQRDPWNNWVFRTSVSGFFSGEETYRDMNVWSNVNADRITERWKTRINANESYSQSEFDVDDSTTFVNIQRSYGGSLLQVKSVGDHLSLGGRVTMTSSTYDNVLRAFKIFPALEYNLFPYSQSTRRQLRVEYNIGYAQYDYRDTTIFDQIRDRMPVQRLLVSGAAKQPWGSLDVGVLGTQYLDRGGTYRVSTFSDVSWRLFKGFDLNVFGAYEIIHDQFGLAKKSFTPEEILTRQFRRGSRYSYWGNVRIAYTFGSILNNVVNPRMVGSFFD